MSGNSPGKAAIYCTDSSEACICARQLTFLLAVTNCCFNAWPPMRAEHGRDCHTSANRGQCNRLLTSYKCRMRLACAELSSAVVACSKLMTSWKKEPPGDGMCSKLSHSCLLAAKDCRRQASSTAAPATLPIPPCRASHFRSCDGHLHSFSKEASKGECDICNNTATSIQTLPL